MQINQGSLTGRQSLRAARRIATATKRVNDARPLGAQAVINAVRAALMSAIRDNPDPSVIGDWADQSLDAITRLHRKEGAGRDIR